MARFELRPWALGGGNVKSHQTPLKLTLPVPLREGETPWVNINGVWYQTMAS